MIRLFLILEIVVFLVASLTHFGLFIHGYEHEKARIAESVIASILLIGLIVIVFVPSRIRIIGLVIQGFALFGTLIGIFTIVIGVGPQSLLYFCLPLLYDCSFS